VNPFGAREAWKALPCRPVVTFGGVRCKTLGCFLAGLIRLRRDRDNTVREWPHSITCSNPCRGRSLAGVGGRF